MWERANSITIAITRGVGTKKWAITQICSDILMKAQLIEVGKPRNKPWKTKLF